MNFIKIKSGPTLIEFHNSIWGEETVRVNGQVVSKQKSIMGAQHFFNVREDGKEVRYVLVTKTGENFTPLLDLYRNGINIRYNYHIHYGSQPQNEFKRKGIFFLKKYKLDEALEQFNKAKDIDKLDAEINLYIACIYSLEEDCVKGYENLAFAKEKNLPDLSVIDKHDMLAFLRIQEAFEGFKASGYTKFDKDLLAKKKEL
ncbi:MAG: hypothetical protein ABIR66_04940 [Saprospiraceae bacterium]